MTAASANVRRTVSRMKVRLAALAATFAALVLAPSAGAERRDAIVKSFDETPIVTHFFTGNGASAADPQPTIMIGPGWGSAGATNPGSAPIADFVAAGYNVLTWDPRGFGGSGGTVMIDHPKFEGRDAQALIDFIAEQAEAELDSPGDPRLGMSGGSYGGGIQLILAGLDQRVDVIAPTIAWNSLAHQPVQGGQGEDRMGARALRPRRPAVDRPRCVQPGRCPGREPEPSSSSRRSSTAR